MRNLKLFPRHASVALACLLASLGCVSEAGKLGMPNDASAEEMAEAKRLREVAFDHYLATETRLQTVSQRLRVAGAPLCQGELNPVLGLTVVGRRDVPVMHKWAAERRYPDDRMRVASVFPGMAAERAGVKPGDVIETIGGERVEGDRIRRIYGKGAEAVTFYRFYKASGGTGPEVELALERDGKPLTLKLERVQGCAYPAALFVSDQINAFAATEHGYTAYYSALVRELRDETTLALVVGHELAHNIINRLDAALPSNSRDHEARADYIGAYLTAAAGYSLSISDAGLFDVLTRGDPNDVGEGAGLSHPMSSQRTLALKTVVAEIRQKQERGETIRPEIQ